MPSAVRVKGLGTLRVWGSHYRNLPTPNPRFVAFDDPKLGKQNSLRRIKLFVALVLALALALASAVLLIQHRVTSEQRSEFAHRAEQLLQDAYANGKGPGAVLFVARGDDVLYRGAIGRDDIYTDDMLSADDIFRIGSVTKQFIAAAVLKLSEEGKLALTDPISKFVDDYPNGEEITVAQLLNHTSGIANNTELANDLQRSWTTAELIDSFKHEKFDFAPGKAWKYSNSGYVLAGAVVEAVSGMPWHEYLHEVFFVPLDMKHTGHGGDPGLAEGQAHGWRLDGPRPVPSVPLNMTHPAAAGALISSVDDLHRWNRALHEGGLLSPASYASMTTPMGKATEAGYGFGLSVGTVRGNPVFEHSGMIPGFRSVLLYMPGPDVSVVLLQNADRERPGGLTPEAISRLLAAAVLGQPYPDAKPWPIEANALSALEGVYRINSKTTRSLRMVDGSLTSRRTGGKRTPLTPIGPDEFLFEDRLSRITIVRDASGLVSGIRFFPLGEDPGQFAPRIQRRSN